VFLASVLLKASPSASSGHAFSERLVIVHPASLFNYAGQARDYCPSIKLTAFPSASLPGLAESTELSRAKQTFDRSFVKIYSGFSENRKK
jgi:hypothetical protein